MGEKIVLPALEITHIAVYLGLAVNWSQFSIFPPVYNFIKFVPWGLSGLTAVGTHTSRVFLQQGA